MLSLCFQKALVQELAGVLKYVQASEFHKLEKLVDPKHLLKDETVFKHIQKHRDACKALVGMQSISVQMMKVLELSETCVEQHSVDILIELVAKIDMMSGACSQLDQLIPKGGTSLSDVMMKPLKQSMDIGSLASEVYDKRIVGFTGAVEDVIGALVDGSPPSSPHLASGGKTIRDSRHVLLQLANQASRAGGKTLLDFGSAVGVVADARGVLKDTSLISFALDLRMQSALLQRCSLFLCVFECVAAGFVVLEQLRCKLPLVSFPDLCMSLKAVFALSACVKNT
jgi:hypothetical protein